MDEKNSPDRNESQILWSRKETGRCEQSSERRGGHGIREEKTQTEKSQKS